MSLKMETVLLKALGMNDLDKEGSAEYLLCLVVPPFGQGHLVVPHMCIAMAQSRSFAVSIPQSHRPFYSIFYQFHKQCLKPPSLRVRTLALVVSNSNFKWHYIDTQLHLVHCATQRQWHTTASIDYHDEQQTIAQHYGLCRIKALTQIGEVTICQHI